MSRSSSRALPARVETLTGCPQLPSAGREATWATVQSPFDWIQPTIACPSPSTARRGREAFRLGAETTTGSDQIPSGALDAASTTR